MNHVYIVIEEAVYRHRILGVYDTQAQAEARALEVAMAEDDHHHYCVLRVERNVPTNELGGWGKTRCESRQGVGYVCYFKRPYMRYPENEVKAPERGEGQPQ